MINAQEFFTSSLALDDDLNTLLAYTEDEEGEHLANIFEFPCDEELADNPDKPYIVVKNSGTQQDVTTKDDGSFDPQHDLTTIEVLCVADDRDTIKAVAQAARDAIRIAMDEYSGTTAEQFGFDLEDSTYSDQGINYDHETTNYFATLQYRIETEA